ncbi:DUF4199 domain-containing protein [Aquimarina algiphila]|uniref:DUF4199 domain-containing protein n=1 Tax=Aquimarina algiphila TaxID=2047982 RepID=UPI002490DB74|nr:DUF4199 domain-containing protein [Aquimarina algiphila]
MEEITISTKKHILTYGLILGLIWLIYGVIRYLTNNIITSHWGLPIIELSIHISIIIYGIYTYKSNNGGFLKLSQALKIGFSIALIGTGIQILWDIILLKIISPEIVDQLISLNKKQTVNELTNQENTIDNKTNIIFIRSLISLIGNLVLGILISLFAGAIMQKKRNEY